MVFVIKISNKKTEQPWLYMIIMLLIYTIHLIMDRIRMIICLILIHLFYTTFIL